MFERILHKLIVIHFIILILVQGFFITTPVMKSLNKIYLYEGVFSDHHENKLDVLKRR
ncbi:DUF5359 family protein [Siminovitchia sediminis]|uniref:DUF5359 family protein n=1 Tax=Siminovitchia sediminis TaxID=1274353 RepID=A0ABW4KGG1_9BACI